MVALLTKGGKLVVRGGALLSTLDPAECPCCGAIECNICCSETVPQFATMTISGVLPLDPEDCVDCPDWNAAWELSLTSGDLGNGDECFWELDDGPCGFEYVRLRIGTCQDGTQNYTIAFRFGDTVGFYCTETINPIDCETFWDHTRTFTFATGSDVECRWDLATITIDFHN